MSWRGDTGGALITALLAVALMSAVSLSLVEHMRAGLLRAGVLDDRLQAEAFLDGAAAFSEAMLIRARGSAGQVATPDGPWDGRARVFDVDGGRLAGAILDRNNCLNVNALYSGTDQRDADEAAAERFRLLFSALDLPLADSESLIAQAADWIDPDASIRPGGAEDYMTRDGQRRRAANQPLIELAELRALPVMTPALFARIEPFVCVLPTPDQPPLNLNTLRTEQSVLITAMTDGAISPAAAAGVIFRRPSSGFSSMEQVWRDPAFAALEEEARPAARVALRSDWFELHLDVQLDRAALSRRQLIRIETGGAVARFPAIQGAVL